MSRVAGLILIFASLIIFSLLDPSEVTDLLEAFRGFPIWDLIKVCFAWNALTHVLDYEKAFFRMAIRQQEKLPPFIVLFLNITVILSTLLLLDWVKPL